MKKKFIPLIIFVSAGAVFQTALADDAQIKAGAQSHEQPDANVELRGNINEPSGAELNANISADQMMRLQRASDLIGTDVRNQQDEKLGEIKDVMVDLQSGQAPFAVISSGGFFGVGDRMLAIPTTTLSQNAGQDQFVLSMDRERLKAAPSFDKNNWPDMNDQSWRSEVYSYYGAQQPAQASVAANTQTEINEAAGAQRPEYSERYQQRPGYSDRYQYSEYGETTSGLVRDRRPRQGLGAEDLTQNEQKLKKSAGYAQSGAVIEESTGAERTYRATTTPKDISAASRKTKRASDLIGMEVKNAQGERIGEIKDVVIDMKSGRVAYAALDAGGILGTEDKLYAVPPTVLTQTGDEHWLVFNTDKQTLQTAPSFDKSNWPQANNQQFTTEVYRYYHQQPYWQSSRGIQEPSGAQPKMQHRDERNSSGEWQKGNYNSGQQQEDQNQIQEPSGAAPAPVPGGELNEPTPQTEPERNSGAPLGSEQNQINGSAAKETAEIQSTPQYQQQQSQVQQEPAGAKAESTAPATSEDQAGSDADRRMSQQLRTTLQSDPSLSNIAPNVQVSTANGRITLRGTVSSEQEKQSIADKAKEIAGSEDKVDNQLQVRGESTNP